MSRKNWLRTKVALRIAPWLLYEVPLQELEAIECSIPECERGSATHTLIKTFISGYRRQSEEAGQ